MSRQIERLFNKQNKCFKEIEISKDISTETHFDNHGNVIFEESKNMLGDVISSKEIKRSYDDNGNEVGVDTTVTEGSNTSHISFRYKYNKYGHIIYRTDGKSIEKYRHRYNKDGKIVSRKRIKRHTSIIDGEEVSVDVVDYETKCIYDENGRIFLEISDYTDGLTIRAVCEYAYNDKGEIICKKTTSYYKGNRENDIRCQRWHYDDRGNIDVYINNELINVYTYDEFNNKTSRKKFDLNLDTEMVFEDTYKNIYAE